MYSTDLDLILIAAFKRTMRGSSAEQRILPHTHFPQNPSLNDNHAQSSFARDCLAYGMPLYERPDSRKIITPSAHQVRLVPG